MSRSSLRLGSVVVVACLLSGASVSCAQRRASTPEPARDPERARRPGAPTAVAPAPGVVSRDLTRLPPGWKLPHPDRQKRVLVGSSHPVVVDVLLDDQSRLRVVRDGVPGPPFDDLRLDLFKIANGSGHVAYVGLRGDQHYVCTSAGSEFPCPRFSAMSLTLSETSNSVAYVVHGVRGVDGATLYIDGEQLFQDRTIGQVTFGPREGHWSTVVAGQCTAPEPMGVRLLTQRGLGPVEYGLIALRAWSPNGERLLYTGGEGSIVLLEGTDERARWKSPAGYTYMLEGTASFSPDSRQVAWVGSTRSDNNDAHPLIDGRPIALPKDERLFVLHGLNGRLNISPQQWCGDPGELLFRTWLPDGRIAVRKGDEVLGEGWDAGALVLAPHTDALHWLTSRRVASRPTLVWIHNSVAGPDLEANQTVLLTLSPDGAHHAYGARIAGEREFTLVVDGKPLAGPKAIAAHVAYAPDSSRLAYFSTAGVTLVELGAAGASDIRSFGSEPETRWPPQFTADSKHVAYISKSQALCGDGRVLAQLKSAPIRPDPFGKLLFDTDPIRNVRDVLEPVGASSVRILQVGAPVAKTYDVLETIADLAVVAGG